MQHPIQQLSLIYYEAAASLRRPRNWFPLLVFWFGQALLLWLVTQFMRRPGGEALAGFLQSQFGAEATEYPRFYLLLPDMHRRLYLTLAATGGVLLQGVSLLHLLGWHTAGKLQRQHPWRRALRRWPGLVLINLVSLSCFLLPLLAVERWLLPILAGAGISRAAHLAGFGLGILAEILLLYAPFLYVSFSSSWWTALRSSAAFARSHFGMSLVLVLVPFFLALPIHGLTRLRRAIVLDFRPELMFYVLLLTSIVTLLVLFLQLSSLVRYYTEEVLRRPFMGEWDDKHEAEYPDQGI